MEALFLEPLVQFGFAGFCAALLAILVWMIGRTFKVIDRNSEVISGNTRVMEELRTNGQDQLRLMRRIHEQGVRAEAAAGQRS